MGNAIFSGQYAADDVNNGLVFFGRRRGGRLIGVRHGNVVQEITHILFADDLQLGQGKYKGFANSKCSEALRI